MIVVWLALLCISQTTVAADISGYNESRDKISVLDLLEQDKEQLLVSIPDHATAHERRSFLESLVHLDDNQRMFVLRDAQKWKYSCRPTKSRDELFLL